ncbi:MAG: 2Fe-2S iron-sulfur cluster binding domain-containing protein [Gammaproteobacteria bacterium]|nr:MAG: 2Fe-2S iron-sulfur cluster binding domain-containing protein [Gammaproteobacteria bacterium]
MLQLLTLSRAARLVGVARGALQKRIRAGELPAFEGMVAVADLQRLFPNAHIEDEATLERYALIKDVAYTRRLRERILPDPEVLAARLTQISRDLARAKGLAEEYRGLLDRLEGRLGDLARTGARDAAELRSWLRRELEQGLRQARETQPLVVEDSVLRIMTAHVRLLPSQHEFFVEGNDTILDAALRAGLALDYGCSSGNCGLCKGKVLSGQVKKTRPHDYVLTDAEKAAGEILLCCHTAVTDLVVEAQEAGGARDIPRQTIVTRVKLVEPLAADMRLLHLQTPRTNRLRFLAGQHVTLKLADGAEAELPVASCPCDDRNLQFHVCRSPGDDFAARVFERLRVSDPVTLDGPRGEFVLHDGSTRPLIFLACDTGFAPIKSLIEHAMSLEAAESMHLYWIARDARGHYMQNLCRAWSDALDDFHYTPLTLENAGTEEERMARALAQVVKDHPDIAEHDVYVAGAMTLMAAAQKVLVSTGLPPEQLFAGYVR